MRTERVDLPDVSLTCTVAGDGPVVIAAHGFPDDAETFRPQLPALVAAGYRVVLPTMRSYAPSGLARSGRYDIEAVARDLVGLADHFSPRAPVRLVGHDWGAVAAFAAVAMAPERFSHLATLAVPHPRAFVSRFASAAQLRRSWYIGFFQLPIVSEAALRANDFAFIDRLWRAWSPGYRSSAEEMRAVKDGIRDRVGPVLAYYRAALSPRALFGPARGLLFTRVRIPAIHIHGVDDGCAGIECVEGAEDGYAGAYTLHRIAGAGHFVQREKPAEVSRILEAFLGR